MYIIIIIVIIIIIITISGCDQLRCLSCDSSVLSFNNYSWTDDVEYLFFRNNYPNNKKLKTKLVYSEGNSYHYVTFVFTL